MVDPHALRTRAPLDPKISFDLHVLSMPPAFNLSQDQTLQFNIILDPKIRYNVDEALILNLN